MGTNDLEDAKKRARRVAASYLIEMVGTTDPNRVQIVAKQTQQHDPDRASRIRFAATLLQGKPQS